MIPGYRDSARIVGRVVYLHPRKFEGGRVLLCNACFADFAVPFNAETEDLGASHGYAAEPCDECGQTIGSEPANSDQEPDDYPDWPERPHDTALIGSKR
jgi:hypothetical protein